MPAGAELAMGNWELEVDAIMDEQHFRSVSQLCMPDKSSQVPLGILLQASDEQQHKL